MTNTVQRVIILFLMALCMICLRILAVVSAMYRDGPVNEGAYLAASVIFMAMNAVVQFSSGREVRK